MISDIIKNKLYIDDILKSISRHNLKKLFESKILITGGCGLIGSTIVDILVCLNKYYNANISIIIADLNKEIFESRFKCYEGIAFFEYNSIVGIKFQDKYDYIICSAGIANPVFYVKKPVETMLSNVNGIQNILNEIVSSTVKKIMYISSSEVYGNIDGVDAYVEGKYGAINIDDIRSSYSIGKIASEMLCKSYNIEYGVPVTIARPGHVFGPTLNYNDTRISSDFALKAALGKDLVMKSKGEQKRSYVYSVDCAMALIIIMLNGESGEVYNVSNKDSITIFEMAHILAGAGNVALKIELPDDFDIRKFNPMKNSTLACSKLYSLGYINSFSAEEGLIHTVKIIKDLI